MTKNNSRFRPDILSPFPVSAHDHSSEGHDHSHEHEDNNSIVFDDEGHQHQHHHPHHHLDDEKTLRQKISDLADKIKSVDGIDETAHLFGQILPGIAGPIATASILTIATPFVFLGIIGMKHEYAEAKEELVDILMSKKDNEKKLLDLVKFSQEKRDLLHQKLLGIKPENKKLFAPKISLNEAELIEAIHNHEQIENRELILKISRKYGWTGILGMAGMSAGMIPATVTAAFEIAIAAIDKNNVATRSLESGATVTELIAGSFFLIGQTAMFAYAANRKVQGNKAKKTLNSALETFNANSKDALNEEVSENILQIISKQKHFLKNHTLQYANMTMAGQVLMGTGTAVGMTGLGLPASVPFLATGAPLTIYPAINRIIWQERETRFKGEDAKENDFVQEILEQNNAFELLRETISSDNSQPDLNDKIVTLESYDQVSQKLQQPFLQVTKALAQVKIYSLIHHLINRKKFRKLSPEKKLEKLEAILNRDKATKFYSRERSLRGGLEDKVVGYAKDFFQNNKETLRRDFFDSLESKKHAIQLNSKLDKKVLDLLSQIKYKSDDEKSADEKRSEMSELIDCKFSDELILKTKKSRDYSRDVINKSKASLKALRFQLAQEMVNVSFCKEIFKNEIDHEQETFYNNIFSCLEKSFIESFQKVYDINELNDDNWGLGLNIVLMAIKNKGVGNKPDETKRDLKAKYKFNNEEELNLCFRLAQNISGHFQQYSKEQNLTLNPENNQNNGIRLKNLDINILRNAIAQNRNENINLSEILEKNIEFNQDRNSETPSNSVSSSETITSGLEIGSESGASIL